MKHLCLTLVAAATLCQPLSAQNKVRYVSTNAPSLPVEQIAEGTAQISRILFAGYNSICLPTTLDAEQLQTAAPGAQVERLAAIRQEGSVLCMYFLDCTDEGIEAGQPYLIYSPKLQTMRVSTANANGVSTRLQPVTLTDNDGNRIRFGSSWQSVSGNGRYGIPAQQDTDILQSILVSTTAEKTFLPTRCGFDWEAQSPTATTLEIRHVASLAGIETSISELRASDATVDVYDLSGRHAAQGRFSSLNQQLAPGIYVVNGVKVAIK